MSHAKSTNHRVYCADLCLASGEPMLGTAAQVDVWLLLEYKPTWRPKAVQDNDLAPSIQAWMDSALSSLAASGHKARAQFIRRPEIDSPATTLFIARDGQLLRFEGDGYREIQTLDVTSPRLTPVTAPHYFVCTNGQRDLCCARLGLPTYARLREAVGDRVWQTTHVGGHRFAPNVLALPQGALYGRVFADQVDAFLTPIETGDLSLPHLRGHSAYPPQAQVAEALIPGACALTAIDGNQVTFETTDGSHTVNVQRAETPCQVIASCGESEPETVFPFGG